MVKKGWKVGINHQKSARKLRKVGKKPIKLPVQIFRVLTFLFAIFSIIVSVVTFSMSWVFAVLALQEGLQAVFLLAQKKPTIPANLWTILPYLLIFLVLLTGQVQVKTVVQGGSLALLLTGVFLVLWALFTLRRNFGIFAEVREVVTTGPYKYMRHPMYVGYGLQYLAIALKGTWVTWVAVFVLIGLQILRAWQEEDVLRKVQVYQRYVKTVRL